MLLSPSQICHVLYENHIQQFKCKLLNIIILKYSKQKTQQKLTLRSLPRTLWRYLSALRRTIKQIAAVSEATWHFTATQAGRRRRATVEFTQYIDSWNRQQNGNIIVLSERYVRRSANHSRLRRIADNTWRVIFERRRHATPHGPHASSPATESLATQCAPMRALRCHAPFMLVPEVHHNTDNDQQPQVEGICDGAQWLVLTIYFCLSCVQCVI